MFIDQFEELFTRIPAKEKKLRETFIAALVDAANSGVPNLRLVLAMRDDFFGNLRDHEALFRITDKHLERVIAMKGPELREIIEEPARSHGVRFQDGLVKDITESVEGRAGMLPLLQYTLEALWNQERHPSKEPITNNQQPAGGLADGVLSRKSYDAIGGVEGALQKRVTHFYDSKTVDQRRAVRNILLSLVEVSESSGDATTVSRAAPREALAQAGSEEILKELLDEEKLLISIGGEEDEPLVELAHEALIKGWEEFETWVRESKEAIQMRNRLREDAKRWSGLKGKAAKEELWHGSRLERAIELEREKEFARIGGLGDLERKFIEACQKERKAKIWRLQMAVGFTSLLSVVATLATLVALAVSQIAKEQRGEAEKQTKAAQIQAGKAHVLRGDIHPLSSDRVFYSARAVGFERLGKPASAARDGSDRGNASAWYALREVRLDIQDAWARLPRGKGRDIGPVGTAEFPMLLAGKEAAEEAAKAYHAIAMAEAQPFLWTSRVASQHSGTVNGVAWSPDGQTLASGSVDQSIKLWDVASGSEDNSIKLWEVATGKEKAILAGHSGPVCSVAWSPDGQTLASGSWDNGIKLWDVGSGKEKATLAGHSGHVFSVAWSPDGQTLASGSSDHSIKLWEATVIARTDLYVYLKEGWCRFDPKTENLQWNEPERELYRSIETPFRNVPRWSALGILQRKDLGTDEKHWLLYLKALQAENWAAAALFRARLSPEQRKLPHASVVWGIRTLADQAVSACKAGLPVIARMRVASALGFLDGFEPAQAERFYARLGEGFAAQGIEPVQAEPVLAALPDDAARAVVKAAGPAAQPAPAPK